MKNALAAVCFVAVICAAVLAQVEELHHADVDQEATAILARSVGDADLFVPMRIARRLTVAQLVSAMYSDVRFQRVLAIDAVGRLEDPWPVLPYLAALMSAHSRPVATGAARSLERGLETLLPPQRGSVDGIAPQAEQLAAQLAVVAFDNRLDADLRCVALQGMGRLREIHLLAKPIEVAALLDDAEQAVRRAALALVEVPIREELLPILVRNVRQPDLDPFGSAQSSALLCENALAHGAQAPSTDLTDLLKEVLERDETPADGVVAVLACLRGFTSEGRASLVDLALKHPDPGVKKYWEAQE